MRQDPIEALTALGLNRLEAEVYITLLTSHAMTGYAVAQKLDKPTANVYKALDSLARQGAVVVQEGETKLYAAVPGAEFMRHLERRYLNQTRQAQTSLQSLKPELNYGGIFQLQSAALVLERAKAMLNRCEKVVILDCFPEVVNALRSEIEKAAERGVWVRLQVYQPDEIQGIEVVLSPFSETVLQHWPGQQLNVVIDSREVLLAFLDHSLSRVYQAVWSDSRYLAFIVHLGLHHEYNMQHLITLRDRDGAEAVLDFVGRLGILKADEIPGLPELLNTDWDKSASADE